MRTRIPGTRRESMTRQNSGIVEGDNIAARDGEAGPVDNCPHVHLSFDFRRSACQGTVVETSYEFKKKSGGVSTIAFWLAIIVRAFGYYVELRWLGDETGETVWRNFGSYEPPLDGQPDDRVYYVGYAINEQKMFRAPSSIPVPRIGWTNFIRQNLLRANVLLIDTHDRARRENRSPFELGSIVEVDDIMNIAAVKPASLKEVRGGRLRLVYSNGPPAEGFGSEIWLSKSSPRIIPRGMARILGRRLTSTKTYWDSSWKELLKENCEPDIVNFAKRFVPPHLAEALETLGFKIGAKLEVVDPLRPGKICVGTVVNVLPNFWLEIRIEGAVLEDGSDHVVCFHATDCELLPPGWAHVNKLDEYFEAPEGFSWDRETSRAPPELFQRHIPIHGFKRGQRYEAVGVAGTDLIYSVEIKDVKEPLLHIHFKGYGADEDMFIPITSLDIFPVGYCAALRLPLQAPPRR